MEQTELTSHSQNILVSPELRIDFTLKSLPGASGAKVILMKHDQNYFVKKYANGNLGEKLEFQKNWLIQHYSSGLVPRVLHWKKDELCSYFDMEYIEAKTLFEFVNRPLPDERRTSIFSEVISALKKIHKPIGVQGTSAQVKNYLRKKLYENLKNCELSFANFANISSSKILVINNESMKNWQELSLKILENEALLQELSDVECAELHGDPTFSNILVNAKEKIYFIDPNNENHFPAPVQDFAKLWQSIGIQYEAIEATGNLINVSKDFIDYKFESNIFSHKNRRFFLVAMSDQNLSFKPSHLNLFLAVHLARIIPYRLRSNDPKAWIYLGEMLKLLNTVVDEEC